MAIRIPRQFAKLRGIRVGTELDLEPIEVIRSKKRRRYKLTELMARFKPGHRHPAWDLGHPVGREIW